MLTIEVALAHGDIEDSQDSSRTFSPVSEFFIPDPVYLGTKAGVTWFEPFPLTS